MDNTVEMMAAQVQDDAALTTQENSQTLADVIGETPMAEQPAVERPSVEQPPAKEPGWIKQRVGSAVNKAVAEAEARIRAEYEAKFAPLREAQLAAEADKLVADGKISDREMALNYLRMQQGLPTVSQPTTPAIPVSAPPRDAQGRFVAQPANDVQQRAQALVDQATMLQRATGVDVMAIYNTNQQARQMIVSGAGDFADVLATYGQQPVPKPQAPAAIRSSNGMGLGNVDFAKMSSSQLQKVNEMIQSGVKIDVRV